MVMVVGSLREWWLVVCGDGCWWLVVGDDIVLLL